MTTVPKVLLPEERPELDFQILDKELDRVKTKVFLGENAAFLAHIMCSMDFVWTEQVATAATDGLTLYWNPVWFLQLPKETRATVLVHELWHPALFHLTRRGSRNPEVWNYAADIVINNMLDSQGYSFEGTKPWLDHAYDDQHTEEIYDALMAQQVPPPPGFQWGYAEAGTGQGDGGDLIIGNLTEAQEHELANRIVAAHHSSALGGKNAGSMPGEAKEVLRRFLQPKLPWRQLLMKFFTEKQDMDYSLSRPNRRFEDVYLASRVDDNEGLAHLLYFLDVSGSVTNDEVIRVNSEFKYVKDNFRPDKMTLALFDTKIQAVYEYGPDDPFDELVVIGRGGTSLTCVREMIIKEKPTAVVVFSDLCCAPMEPLPTNITAPMLWIGVNARRGVKVPHGELVHIKE